MQQLTIFICEADKYQDPQTHHSKALYLAIIELVKREGGAGATAVRGLAGYSANTRQIHTGHVVDVQSQLPVVVYIVDEEERIAQLLPQIEAMIAPSGGIITVQDIVVHRHLHPRKR